MRGIENRKQKTRHVGKDILSVAALAFVGFALLSSPAMAATANAYTVTPLVSNSGADGTTKDAGLVNGWGLVAGPTTPWWVSDAGTDLSTLYTAAGAKLGLQVAVSGAPTGIVFNGDTAAFHLGSGAAARFIFSSLGGKILGWTLGLGAAEVMADSSAGGAVYTGLAIATTASGPVLYAPDFANTRVDVFDASWTRVTVAGGFTDPALPAGYAPFGIQTIGDRIFVTFATQAGAAAERGQGLGFVDAFDFAGNLLARVAQHGQLDAPWGLAWAPDNFGRFSGDLLVGNFGNGHISAYAEMANGHFGYRGALSIAEDMPIVIDGLWAIQFGHGATANGPTNTLFFTAGPNNGMDGLFGTVTAT